MISQKIVERFPTESQDVYYMRSVHVRDSVTGSYQKANWKLLNHYNNAKNNVLKPDILLASRDQSLEKQSNDIVTENNIQESLDWLENYEEPWETLENHWHKTYEYRRSKFDSDLTISAWSIYNDWSVLNTPKAYLLVNIDFNLINLCPVDSAISKFDHFCDSALKIHPAGKDSYTTLLQELLEIETLNAGI